MHKIENNTDFYFLTFSGFLASPEYASDSGRRRF